ncbi:MAG TPA: hypothetical protein VG841_13955 [Caulobacterales bacterium]|nr:hypothetical protein [Caulobacterales bacterium]
MFLRSAAFAAVILAAAPTAPAVASASAAACEETRFRVYFERDSAALTPAALEIITAAERNVAGCPYAEVHVSVDAASALAQARGQAVLSALDGRAWNVAQVEPRGVSRVSAGPDYAEVLATPRETPPTAPLAGAHTGV